MTSGSVRRVQPRRRTLVSGSKVASFYIQGPVFLSPRPPRPQRGPEKAQVIFNEGDSGTRHRFSDSSILETEEGPVWGPSGAPGAARQGQQVAAGRPGHGEFPAFGFRLFSLKKKKEKI